MNDMRRLKYRKKSAGGAFERLGLLRKHGINIYPEVLGAVATVPLDDLLATRPPARGRQRVRMPCRSPDPPESCDGLAVAIWY